MEPPNDESNQMKISEETSQQAPTTPTTSLPLEQISSAPMQETSLPSTSAEPKLETVAVASPATDISLIAEISNDFEEPTQRSLARTQIKMTITRITSEPSRKRKLEMAQEAASKLKFKKQIKELERAVYPVRVVVLHKESVMKTDAVEVLLLQSEPQIKLEPLDSVPIASTSQDQLQLGEPLYAPITSYYYVHPDIVENDPEYSGVQIKTEPLDSVPVASTLQLGVPLYEPSTSSSVPLDIEENKPEYFEVPIRLLISTPPPPTTIESNLSSDEDEGVLFIDTDPQFEMISIDSSDKE